MVYFMKVDKLLKFETIINFFFTNMHREQKIFNTLKK